MSNDVHLWLADSILVAMQRIADEKYPNETGGMLLGYVAKNGDVVVTAIVGPGPEAKHGRFRFEPDAKYQQIALENHFYKTDAKETYLGDWHTHPRGSCQLSRIDKRTLAQIARTSSSGIQHPVMAVLCGGNPNWRFEAVKLIGIKRQLLLDEYRLAQLELVTYTSK